MQSVQIQGNARPDIGKKGTKAVRNAGEIPCVIYGGEETIHFSGKVNDFRSLIYTADFKLAEVNVDGKTHKCFVKDIQFHPVTDDILHIDFVELVEGRDIKLEVPVKLIGQSQGSLLGGVVQQKLRKALIKTKPESLVEFVECDISELNLGQSVRVRDIKEVDGVTIMNLDATPVASVNIPRALRSEEAKAEGEEGIEGEEEGATEEAAAE
ncbi:MAG: 50S ribosomal protein L25 [Bacteroidota bacterium]